MEAPGACLFRTVDIGKRHPGWTIDFLGHLCRETKIRGQPVEPGDVERFEPASRVRESVIVIDEASNGDYRRLIAYIVNNLELMTRFRDLAASPIRRAPGGSRRAARTRRSGRPPRRPRSGVSAPGRPSGILWQSERG